MVVDRPQADQKGFTLVELVIAIVLVTTMATVAFSGNTRQLQHVAQSFAETKASRLASSRLEQLRGEVHAPEQGSTEFTFEPNTTEGLQHVIGRQTIRRIETGLFEVAVEISWLSMGAAKRRRFRLVTYIDWEERQ